MASALFPLFRNTVALVLKQDGGLEALNGHVRSGFFRGLREEKLGQLAENACSISELYTNIRALGTDQTPDQFAEAVDGYLEDSLVKINLGAVVDAVKEATFYLKESYSCIHSLKMDFLEKNPEKCTWEGIEVWTILQGNSAPNPDEAVASFSPFSATFFLAEKEYAAQAEKRGVDPDTCGFNTGIVSYICLRDQDAGTKNEYRGTYNHEEMHTIINAVVDIGMRNVFQGEMSNTIAAVSEDMMAGRPIPSTDAAAFSAWVIGDLKNELLAFASEFLVGMAHTNAIDLKVLNDSIERLMRHHEGSPQECVNSFDHTGTAADSLKTEASRSNSSTDNKIFFYSVSQLTCLAVLERHRRLRKRFPLFSRKKVTSTLLDTAVYQTARYYTVAVTNLSEAMQGAVEISPDVGQQMLVAATILKPTQYRHLKKLLPILRDRYQQSHNAVSETC